MSDRVTMPALGESVTEGTVTRWLKQVGDDVAVDEPLLEVSTDKVDTEIPSPVAGVLTQILVSEDETVPVGADLAVLGGDAPDADTATAVPAGESPAGDTTPAEQTEQGAASGHSAEPTSAPADEQAQNAQAAPAPGGPTDAAPADAAPSDAAPADAAPSGPPAGGGSAGAGTTVTMPALGESVTEGTITRWLKAEGDEVAVDEPLLEVSTDKVDTEIPSPVAGVLQKILVGEDETVPVGTDLALVGSAAAAGAGGSDAAPPSESDSTSDEGVDADGDSAPTLATEADEQATARAEAAEHDAPSANTEHVAQEKQAAAQPAAPSDPAAPAAAPAEQQSPAPGGGAQAEVSAYLTPLVRRLATEKKVDLATLTGTGVGGRIRKQDVLDAAKAAEEPPAAEAAPAADSAATAPPTTGTPAHGRPAVPASVSAKRGTTEKMSRLRKAIATRMVESLQTSAQLTTVVEVDVTRVARLRDRAKRDFESREGVKLSFLPFFALAAVEALKAIPTVNASLEGDQIVYHAQENLGIAVDTERGLLVPVVRDAGDLNIAGLARKVADLADRTRNSKITPDELGGGTFTLTNTGSRGALFDTPIINQPQVAILGTGAVVKRAVVVADADGGESIAIRSMVYLALSYDHRIVDGADAARFLMAMRVRLQEGAFDADLGL